MKTKENCLTNLNDVKMILNKKNKPTSNVCRRLQSLVFFHVKLKD